MFSIDLFFVLLTHNELKVGGSLLNDSYNKVV
jgi:hypothetical protein